MERPSPIEMVIRHAEEEAKMGTCPRLMVGAATFTLDDYRTLTMGRNGAPRGEAHCVDVGCLMENGHCVRTVHGEGNAILQAAREGIAIKGAGLGVTHMPCRICTGDIINVGIKAVYFRNYYPSASSCIPQIIRLRKANIKVFNVTSSGEPIEPIILTPESNNDISQ